MKPSEAMRIPAKPNVAQEMQVGAIATKSEVGGCPDREILTAPACVILRLGIRSEDSPPRSRARALGFVVGLLRKRN